MLDDRIEECEEVIEKLSFFLRRYEKDHFKVEKKDKPWVIRMEVIEISIKVTEI